MPDKPKPAQPDRLLYLGGQLNTLLAFVAASIQSHPDRARLQDAFKRSAQLQESQTLNAAVPEDYVRGQQETAAAIEKLFEVLAEAEKKR